MPLTLLTPKLAHDYFLQITRQLALAEKSPADTAIQLRKILDLLTKELTREENQAFSDLNGRLCFLELRYPMPQRLPDELHGIRRLGNRAVHSNDPVATQEIQAAIRNLSLMVSFFSSESLPAALDEQARKHATDTLIRTYSSSAERIDAIRAVVTRIEPRKPTENEGLFYADLWCRSTDDTLDTFSVRLFDASTPDGKVFPGQSFSQLATWAWPYCTVYFFDLRKTGENRYCTDFKSRVVLEPDYLMDATDLAGCFFDKFNALQTNPLLLPMARAEGFQANFNSLLGTLVNDLLDQLIREPGLDWKNAFREALRLRYLQAVRMGRDTLNKIRDSIEIQHFPQIQMVARRYADQRLVIEPTFISARYGLLGRLDGLVLHDDADMQDIFELKSGKAPIDDSVKPEHAMQVLCYHLLLESVSSGKRRGLSSVFYSQTNHLPLRNVNPVPQQLQHLLQVRNEAVHWLHVLENDPTALWKRMRLNKFGPVPRYKEEILKNMHALLEEASPLALAYFETFTAFVQREIRTAKVGDSVEDEVASEGFAALWRLTREDKLRLYNLLEGLIFKRIDEEGNLLFERQEGHSLATNFRQDDVCLIYPADESGTFPLQYQILKCRLLRLDPDGILIRLNNPQTDREIFARRTQWVLEHDFQEKNYHTLFESMLEFLDAPVARQARILGQAAPGFASLNELAPIEPAIWNGTTPHQRQVIEQAVTANDYFLIQGPPGTGKTSTVLTRIVQLRLSHRKESLVVLAFTNRAVAEIEQHLLRVGVPFLRLGAQRSEQSLDRQFEGKNFIEVEQMLREVPVFLSTVASYLNARRDLQEIRQFDTLVVDEASQLLEPHLAGLLGRFKTSILIGDQNQLPAVSIQREGGCKVQEDNPLSGLGFEDLRTSLFERLWKQAHRMASEQPENSSWSLATAMLKDHFRMHASIAEMINPWYHGQLSAGREGQRADFLIENRVRENEMAELLAAHRLVFFGSLPVSTDKCHQQEADRVYELLRILRARYGSHWNPEKHVGVITPWRAQISLIQEKLAGSPDLEAVTVDTVERFQGSEREVIIVSLAVSQHRHMRVLNSETWLEDGTPVDRKLNVTLSRAQEQIILLGDPHILWQNTHYRRVLQHIREQGAWVGEMGESNRLPAEG